MAEPDIVDLSMKLVLDKVDLLLVSGKDHRQVWMS